MVRAPIDIKTVGVLGCGLMGHGIAQICAQADWDVVVRELDQEKLDKAWPRSRSSSPGPLTRASSSRPTRTQIRARITPTLDYSDLATATWDRGDHRDLDGKLEMWGELDGIVKDDAFFATNTSSLSVAQQAAATKRPERFLGLHFFNPAQVMPLLEVVRA